MTQTLTPGRWRGLQTTSSDQHIFSILAFDQRGSYHKMLPEGTSYETAVTIKREIVQALSRYATATLLDPDYGMAPAAAMAASCGLLLSVEKSGYSGDSTYRKVDFDPAWTVAKIKAVGAEAVKLMIYYHPFSGGLADEIEGVTREVIAACHAHDLPLFLEPMSYSLDKAISKESAAFAQTRAEVVIETARRLSLLQPDMLKLEFPVDVAFDADRANWQRTCEAVSAAATVPWVLLSAGVDFATFAEQTEIACRAGASGFLAGRAIWKEAVTMTPAERAAFLEQTAIPRIQELIAIVERTARPWTTFYQPRAFAKSWYAG